MTRNDTTHNAFHMGGDLQQHTCSARDTRKYGPWVLTSTGTPAEIKPVRDSAREATAASNTDSADAGAFREDK